MSREKTVLILSAIAGGSGVRQILEAYPWLTRADVNEAARAGLNALMEPLQERQERKKRRYTEYLEKMRNDFPRAGEPWTRDEEQRLSELANGGAELATLCAEFGRAPRGIVSRLRKLGIYEYDWRTMVSSSP
jgi:hypothetical protein